MYWCLQVFTLYVKVVLQFLFLYPKALRNNYFLQISPYYHLNKISNYKQDKLAAAFTYIKAFWNWIWPHFHYDARSRKTTNSCRLSRYHPLSKESSSKHQQEQHFRGEIFRSNFAARFIRKFSFCGGPKTINVCFDPKFMYDYFFWCLVLFINALFNWFSHKLQKDTSNMQYKKNIVTKYEIIIKS